MTCTGLHGKVHRQRLDHAHNTALALVRGHDVCLACGHLAHADVNAARNIPRAGLVLQET